MKADTTPTMSNWYKFWLVLLAFGTIFWLGGSLVRALIANEFYIPGTVEYDTSLGLDEEFLIFSLIGSSTIVVLIGYVLVLIAGTVALGMFPGRRKDHGWLIMAAILFYLYLPVEVFTGYLDIKYLALWDTALGRFNDLDVQTIVAYKTELKEILSHRVSALSGVPIIAMLCYYTAVVLVVWQPMKRRRIGEVVTDTEQEQQD